ncbi:hypothetical protein ACTFIZ_012598 [Dictyostelium cf. discoideum]
MSSCASINDDVITKYNELILGHKSKGIILKFSDDFKEIVFEYSYNGELFEEFINKFPQDDCRYGVYYFQYIDNKEQSILKKLVGIEAIIKATDNTEISQSLIEERCGYKKK